MNSMPSSTCRLCTATVVTSLQSGMCPRCVERLERPPAPINVGIGHGRPTNINYENRRPGSATNPTTFQAVNRGRGGLISPPGQDPPIQGMGRGQRRVLVAVENTADNLKAEKKE